MAIIIKHMIKQGTSVYIASVLCTLASYIAPGICTV